MKHALWPNAAHEASVVSLRNRYVLVVNSKTAGTTLKTVAAHLEREPLAIWSRGTRAEDRAQRVENWLKTPSLTELPLAMQRDVLLSDSFFRFTTVRNPVSRCWSAWIDKVVGRHPEFVSTYRAEPWMGDCRPHVDELVHQFAKFVDDLHDRPALLGADRHWAPQSRVLQLGYFPYDFIGRTEDLAPLIDAWGSATGLDVASVFSSIGRRNERSLPMPVSQLGEATLGKLNEMYSEDLSRLSYAMPVDRTSQDEWCAAAERVLASMGEVDSGPLRAPGRGSLWGTARRSVSAGLRRKAVRGWVRGHSDGSQRSH